MAVPGASHELATAAAAGGLAGVTGPVHEVCLLCSHKPDIFEILELLGISLFTVKKSPLFGENAFFPKSLLSQKNSQGLKKKLGGHTGLSGNGHDCVLESVCPSQSSQGQFSRGRTCRGHLCDQEGRQEVSRAPVGRSEHECVPLVCRLRMNTRDQDTSNILLQDYRCVVTTIRLEDVELGGHDICSSWPCENGSNCHMPRKKESSAQSKSKPQSPPPPPKGPSARLMIGQKRTKRRSV